MEAAVAGDSRHPLSDHHFALACAGWRLADFYGLARQIRAQRRRDRGLLPLQSGWPDRADRDRRVLDWHRVRRAGGTDDDRLVGRQQIQDQAAALVDALMQGASAEAIRKAVLVPLEAEQSAAKAARAEKAAATKVEFFTMARGED